MPVAGVIEARDEYTLKAWPSRSQNQAVQTPPGS